MARAIRVISVQRGHDPRDYALMAWRRRPLHAARLGSGSRWRVVVPRNPGILCAMGLLLTDLRADCGSQADAAADGAQSRLAEPCGTAQRAERWFGQEGIAAADRRLTRTVDMRYEGQNYELAVALPDGPIEPATLDALIAGFTDAHRQRYGFAAEGEQVQIVTLRLEAVGTVEDKPVYRASRFVELEITE